MGNLFHSFHVLALTLLLLTGHTHNTPHHVVYKAQTIIPKIHIVRAHGTISRYGQTIAISLSFPQNGGAVQGSISDACTGGISGNYTGGENGTLTGSTSATCHVLFATITGKAQVYAKVNLDTTSINLHARIEAQGATQDITVPLILDK